ncbi:GNAT family N-acetyltransferase [Streptomyces chromofuscus]|uniref:GNAT family N-acetyltransferase n=1 Tax=Streptomyces chromofuscus TaxID=42881 RepID=A0A7M2TH52_STRCW|nr:GNAT family N-acetyltransferase [Streptomyces chromofuscus]QOV47273.1 GNAT family N-acetyltransferase [Streptomyces chromofuscus]
MTKRWVVLGGGFEERIGGVRAVVDGDWVHVAGTSAFDSAAASVPDDVVEQAEQCLRNVGAVLAEAGCTFADVVRVRYLLPAREDLEACLPVLRRVFGPVRPAATVMVCGLADARMRIGVEVDARRGPVDGVRIEVVEGERMLEQWRHVHNTVVPPGALSLGEVRERSGRYRLENAYVGEVLVGCSTVRPAEREGGAVTVIARVLPEWRGRGVGRVLYENGLAYARVLGAGVVETCVLAANGDGLRFAESRGFVEVDRYVLPEGLDEWVDLRRSVIER